MTNPYPHYPPPRKLERSRTDRVLGGVCGGVASYLNMDPTLIRVLTVIASIFFGAPVIVYLIALFVMPEEEAPGGPQGYPPVHGGGQWSYGYRRDDEQGHVPPAEPSYAPSPSPQAAPRPPSGGIPHAEDPAVWGPDGAPWEQGPTRGGAGTPNDPPAGSGDQLR